MGTHKFIIEGTEYQVEVGRRTGNTIPVIVNGRLYHVEIKEASARPGVSAPAAPAASQPAATPAPIAVPVSAAAGAHDVVAPISGVILRVAVKPGQTVEKGALLLVIEAMKMENEIYAPLRGVVAGIAVQPQQDVRQGDLLLTLKPA